MLGCVLVGCAGTASAGTNEVPYRQYLWGQSVQCGDFKHDPDGSWTTLRVTPMQRQDEFTTIGPGAVIKAGGPKIVGMDVGAVLDKVCPH